jgi:hypothetical protein
LIEASEEEKYSNNIMLFCSQNFIMNNDDPALAAIVMTPVERALLLIGFNPLERSRIIADGFASFEDLRDLTEKDIRTMAKDFSRKPVARGVSYGLTRVRKTLGLMHWAQDSYRISCVPDIATLTNDAIVVANQRALVRGKEEQQYETICKTALPSKLKDEKGWPVFHTAFLNYLKCMPGVTGVHLSYVCRENEMPALDAEYADYISQAIACAPLSGPYYEADARRVHQIIQSLVQGEAAEAWIKKLVKFQDGRKDLKALISHYAGEGNSTRRLAEAGRMYANLHYKCERALPFATFLDQMIKMFNIFFDEKEAMSEGAKVRFLFKKISNPGLTATVAALTVEHNIKGITFVSAANHIASAVSELPEYQQVRVSAVGSENNDDEIGQDNDESVDNGSEIHTGYYSKEEWEALSHDDIDAIYQAREEERLLGGNQDLGKEEESPEEESSESKKHRAKKGVSGGKRDSSAVSTINEEDLQRIVKAVRIALNEV